MRKIASSRSFGLLLTCTVMVLASLSYWAQNPAYRYWSAAGFVLLAISLLMPRVLAPLKRAWLRFGQVIHLVLNPVILGAIYVLVFIPFGILARLVGKDPLSLRRNPTAGTYWIKRDSKTKSQLRDQF